MPAKIKRSLKSPSIGRNIALPDWIAFWSLVFCTMIMIVATFSQAIQPILDLRNYDSTAVIAQR